MIFIESPRFPDSISVWAKGGPGFNTTVIIVNSGYEQRNINWSQARAKYDIAQAFRTLAASGDTSYAASQLISFFNIANGMANGFRFKDWNDFQVTVANGTLGTSGLGVGVPTYQLYKNYVQGAAAFHRIIQKLVSSNPTPAIYRNGVLQTVTTNYTIDTTTGIVTWVPDSQRAISNITNANPAVVTTSLTHPFVSGDLIYITGVTGMTPINGYAYPITVLDAHNFEIGANTLSYPAYTGSGTAYKYPQNSDELTWSGEFDVPVRFDTDVLMGGQIESGLYEVDNLSVIEIRV